MPTYNVDKNSGTSIYNKCNKSNSKIVGSQNPKIYNKKFVEHTEQSFPITSVVQCYVSEEDKHRDATLLIISVGFHLKTKRS